MRYVYTFAHSCTECTTLQCLSWRIQKYIPSARYRKCAFRFCCSPDSCGQHTISRDNALVSARFNFASMAITWLNREYTYSRYTCNIYLLLYQLVSRLLRTQLACSATTFAITRVQSHSVHLRAIYLTYSPGKLDPLSR